MVTGKNKEQFEKWYVDFYNKSFPRSNYANARSAKGFVMEMFYTDKPFEMRLGVYLAYYDSLGESINVNSYNNSSHFENGYTLKKHKTRNEAYKEAFKQADKQINKKL